MLLTAPQYKEEIEKESEEEEEKINWQEKNSQVVLATNNAVKHTLLIHPVEFCIKEDCDVKKD